MDLRQLEYVLAVSEELNFTRAAERCHIAQSALSHQIGRLERELGSRLFERSSRSVRVTEAGETLAATARQILDSVGRVRAEIDAIGGLTRGRLAIGATQTALRALDVVAVFDEFHHRHPDVELSLALGRWTSSPPASRPVPTISRSDTARSHRSGRFISSG
jgi:DNA-binding transcriptional LysR family regulator